jgi:hypothetical protein
MSSQNNLNIDTENQANQRRTNEEATGSQNAQWPPMDLYQQIDALISSNAQSSTQR